MKCLDMFKKAALPLLAAVLVLGAAAGNSSSYFTTYATAQGGETVRLHDVHVEVEDSVTLNTKNITVRNNGEAPCYVRAKAIMASAADLPPISYSGEGWTPGGDGYYYYAGILNVGQSAPTLNAELDLPDGQPLEKPIPKDAEYNVQVVAECTKVLFDSNGDPIPNGPDYVGWTLKEG